MCFKKPARERFLQALLWKSLYLLLFTLFTMRESSLIMMKQSSPKTFNFSWLCRYSILEKKISKNILGFFFWICCLTKAAEQCFLFFRKQGSNLYFLGQTSRWNLPSFCCLWLVLGQQRVNVILPQELCNWGVNPKSSPCPASPFSADEVTAPAFRLSRNASLLSACSPACTAEENLLKSLLKWPVPSGLVCSQVSSGIIWIPNLSN